ncbi:MAG: 5'/3'-nucleotidase SurE [Desulfobacterales bacterium]|nr:5'/3'-nucleotidase SurE [Desulfobacterales bacterium]MDD4071033.1 5'/3'-nucleotidase SurE [Desulfobacterales bacterium]MDD4392429.1 5'/3'-nucleotidase SurE [Desulfobacterales bacterium]
MNILLTNDDGIYADGLWALYDHLCKRHHVSVIAPDRERSAVGHGITLHQPLRAVISNINGCTGYAVNGTPADCIKIGILEILAEKPDLVVSGINPGANVGIHINYSGTVAAAKEATLCGIKAIAVSLQGRAALHYDAAAEFATYLSGQVLEKGLPEGTFLNVNIPDMPLDLIDGIRISRQCSSMSREHFEKRLDPDNRSYFWPRCEPPDPGNSEDVDQAALNANHISITPIKCDTTDYGVMEELRKWDMHKGLKAEG